MILKITEIQPDNGILTLSAGEGSRVFGVDEVIFLANSLDRPIDTSSVPALFVDRFKDLDLSRERLIEFMYEECKARLVSADRKTLTFEWILGIEIEFDWEM